MTVTTADNKGLSKRCKFFLVQDGLVQPISRRPEFIGNILLSYCCLRNAKMLSNFNLSDKYFKTNKRRASGFKWVNDLHPMFIMHDVFIALLSLYQFINKTTPNVRVTCENYIYRIVEIHWISLSLSLFTLINPLTLSRCKNIRLTQTSSSFRRMILAGK